MSTAKKYPHARLAYQVYHDMGVANAREAIDQVDGFFGGNYDEAHGSYLGNVMDTAREMGARPGSLAYDIAVEAFSEKFSELHATQKQRRKLRRKKSMSRMIREKVRKS